MFCEVKPIMAPLSLSLSTSAKLPEIVAHAFACLGRFTVSPEHLFQFVTFQLRLRPPSTVRELLVRAHEDGLIVPDGDAVALVDSLQQAVRETWDAQRQTPITVPPQAQATAQGPLPTGFNKVIKFLDPGKQLPKAFRIHTDRVKYKVLSRAPPKVVAEIAGKDKTAPAQVLIDVGKRVLKHECQDFTTEFRPKKKLCFHVMKLLILLKKDHPEVAVNFATDIAEHLDAWEFTDF